MLIEKLYELEDTLRLKGFPIVRHLNPGISRDTLLEKLAVIGFENEQLTDLYLWHNGVNFKVEPFVFEEVSLLPNVTFYDIDTAFSRRDELIEWGLLEDSTEFLPVFGGLEDDMSLFRSPNIIEIYDFCPSANIYGEPDFRSLSQMIDVILQCYKEDIITIDSNYNLDFDWHAFNALKAYL